MSTTYGVQQDWDRRGAVSTRRVSSFFKTYWGAVVQEQRKRPEVTSHLVRPK